uniref:Uncharacterized protein n=1 Tax=Panagrolaimus sp. ES5 TaxID=591445 RepID=A0AC34FRS2_9BILA
MVVHVGFHFYAGEAMAFTTKVNPETKAASPEFCEIKFDECMDVTRLRADQIDKIISKFTAVKLKVNGRLGCACICLSCGCDYKVRRLLISAGLNFEFHQVSIIDRKTAQYLNAISQCRHRINHGDFIWVYNTVGNWCSIWQKFDEKAKYIDDVNGDTFRNDLARIVKKHKLYDASNIVFYEKEMPTFMLYFLVDIKFCEFQHQSHKDGALIKARMMGGEREFASFEVNTQLASVVNVCVKGKEILTCGSEELLPLEKSIKVKSNGSEKTLKVVINTNVEDVCLPPFAKFLLTVAIDINKIYTIHFEKLPSNESADVDIDVFRDESIHMPHMFIKHPPKLITSAELSKPYDIPKRIKINNSQINAVGIDLGTTRCCVAVNRKNDVETAKIDDIGDRLLPSYVELGQRNPICGQLAVNRLRNHSKSTVFDTKRIIGRDFVDIEIDENWPFEVINTENKPVIRLESRDITAEEVAGMLLKHVKNKCQEFQGKELSEAVITVPAAFTDAQKDATIFAAKLAGFITVELLPEPIAAAFAYFIDRPIPNNSTVLLFDLGGGTLDVCIFKIQNNHIQIISRSGNLNLGGRDFDNLLFNHFWSKLNIEHKIESLGNKKYVLMSKCQDIKHSLSVTTEDQLDVSDFDTAKEEEIKITRSQFEAMSKELVFDTTLTIDAALKNIDFEPNKIDKVLLVGGGCRMPMIKKLLEQKFCNAEHCCEGHPDEVVATGAAYFAYYLNTVSINKPFNRNKIWKRPRYFSKD